MCHIPGITVQVECDEFGAFLPNPPRMYFYVVCGSKPNIFRAQFGLQIPEAPRVFERVID